eukprot:scaffold97477_cov69-Phaeocystis_antarctica.AAC.1
MAPAAGMASWLVSLLAARLRSAAVAPARARWLPSCTCSTSCSMVSASKSIKCDKLESVLTGLSKTFRNFSPASASVKERRGRETAPSVKERRGREMAPSIELAASGPVVCNGAVCGHLARKTLALI